MEPEKNILKKVDQAQKDKYCFLSYGDPTFKSSLLCLNLEYK